MSGEWQAKNYTVFMYSTASVLISNLLQLCRGKERSVRQRCGRNSAEGGQRGAGCYRGNREGVGHPEASQGQSECCYICKNFSHAMKV